MYHCRMTAYEGTSPYIFVSYAHKDSEQVLPILDELADRGYRVWYDDGIAPGSEWPEYIATHLAGSALVLAFISPNSIASPNCRREVTFALAQNKPFVGIYISETQMSPGMEMQLSAQQCLMKFNMTDEAFYRKLCAISEIVPCKAARSAAQPGTVSPAVSPIVPQSAASVSPAPAASITDEDMEAVAHMQEVVEPVRVLDMSDVPPDAPVMEAKPVSGKKSEGRLKKLLIPILAAAAAILIFMLVLTLSPVKINGESYSRSASYIHLENLTIDDATIGKLSKLNHLNSLYLVNCNVTGDLSAVKRLPELMTLSCTDTKFSDLSFLADSTGLYTLILDNCGITDTDLPDLSACTRLSEISLSGNPEFSDVEKLPLANLSRLVLSDTGVANFEPLAAVEKLNWLDIGHTAITSAETPIKSLRLTHLNIDGLKLDSIEGLTTLTTLTYFSAEDCGLSELSLLESNKNTGTLDTLRLSGNPLSSTALAIVRECRALTKLELDHVPMDDLSVVSDMNSLTSLHAVGCGISDASALSGCTMLKVLLLSDNKLTAIDLVGLTDVEYLDLSHNELSDLTALPAVNYDSLLLQGNPVDPATIPTPADGTATALVVEYADGLEAAPALQCYYNLLIVNAPLDKQAALEDATFNTVRFVEEGAVEAAVLESSSDPDNYSPYDWYIWKQYLPD